MSKTRFKEFVRYVRFDDKETRQERQLTDKLAAIRKVSHSSCMQKTL